MGEALAVALESARVVARAHSVGQLHGALSPSRIRPGAPVEVQQAASSEPNPSDPFAMCWSPPRWDGAEPSLADDVFALAMVVALTLSPTSSTWSFTDAYVRWSMGLPVVPDLRALGVSDAVASVLEDALSPSARVSDAGALADALEGAGLPHALPADVLSRRLTKPGHEEFLEAAEDTVGVEPDEFIDRMATAGRRRKRALLGVGLGMIGLVGVGYQQGVHEEGTGLSVVSADLDVGTVELAFARFGFSVAGEDTEETIELEDENGQPVGRLPLLFARYALSIDSVETSGVSSLRWRLESHGDEIASGDAEPEFPTDRPDEAGLALLSVATDVGRILCEAEVEPGSPLGEACSDLRSEDAAPVRACWEDRRRVLSDGLEARCYDDPCARSLVAIGVGPDSRVVARRTYGREMLSREGAMERFWYSDLVVASPDAQPERLAWLHRDVPDAVEGGVVGWMDVDHREAFARVWPEDACEVSPDPTLRWREERAVYSVLGPGFEVEVGRREGGWQVVLQVGEETIEGPVRPDVVEGLAVGPTSAWLLVEHPDHCAWMEVDVRARSFREVPAGCRVAGARVAPDGALVAVSDHLHHITKGGGLETVDGFEVTGLHGHCNEWSLVRTHEGAFCAVRAYAR